MLDAVQQLCAALPRYFKALGDQSAGIKQQRYYAIAEHLTAKAVQEDCVLSLYEEDSPDTVINGTSWQLVDSAEASYTITIDFLELLEIAYDEPPAECKSIFDNDDNVAPLIDVLLSDVDPFTLSIGNGRISNSAGLSEDLDPGVGSLLATALEPASGDLQLVNFVLKGGATKIVVGSVPYEIDRWSLRLMSPVTASPGLGGTYTYPAGSMTVLATVFAAGDAMSLTLTNTREVTVLAGSAGWLVRGFEVEYNDNGTLWTWSQTSNLEFN